MKLSGLLGLWLLLGSCHAALQDDDGAATAADSTTAQLEHAEDPVRARVRAARHER